jgi:hypothetical protein
VCNQVSGTGEMGLCIMLGRLNGSLWYPGFGVPHSCERRAGCVRVAVCVDLHIQLCRVCVENCFHSLSQRSLTRHHSAEPSRNAHVKYVRSLHGCCGPNAETPVVVFRCSRGLLASPGILFSGAVQQWAGICPRKEGFVCIRSCIGCHACLGQGASVQESHVAHTAVGQCISPDG